MPKLHDLQLIRLNGNDCPGRYISRRRRGAIPALHFGKGYSRMQREAARTEARTASGEAEKEKQKEKRIRRN